MNASEGNNPLENNRPNKSTRGRQKVAMEKIESQTNLQVTFSKRRAGLFKKANELGTLCGAESAIVVFSPSGKAHSFGHPNVEAVSNRFLTTNAPPIRVPHRGLMQQRNQELTNMEGQLELEKQRKKELERMRKESGVPPRIEDLNHQQLDELQRSILGFQQDFETKVNLGFNHGINPHVEWGTASNGPTNPAGLINPLAQGSSSGSSNLAPPYNPNFGNFDQFMFPYPFNAVPTSVDDLINQDYANPKDSDPMEPQADFQGFNNNGFNNGGGYIGG